MNKFSLKSAAPTAPSSPPFLGNFIYLSKLWLVIQTLVKSYAFRQGGFVAFVVLGMWTLLTSFSLQRGYQDSWVLEGIGLPLLVTFGAYIVNLTHSNVRRTATLTALMIGIAYAAPSLKYDTVYFTTIDVATHFSLIERLSSTGFPDRNIYVYTPGLHMMTASITQLSGYRPEIWATLLSPILSGLAPFSFYALVKRLAIPDSLGKAIIVLSGVSLPILYLLNGTTFALLIIIPLLSILLTSMVGNVEIKYRRAYFVLAVLLLANLAIWHAISSIIISSLFLICGIFMLLWNLVAYKVKRLPSWKGVVNILVLGSIGLAFLLSYWYFIATPIWDQLIENVEGFASAIEAKINPSAVPEEVPTDPPLIPSKAATVSKRDLFLVFSLYHIRDAVMSGLAGLGILLAIGSIVWSKRIQVPNQPLIMFMSVFFIAFALIVITVLATGFAKQGYRRFVLYLIAFTPILGAYTLWWFAQLSSRILRIVSPHAIFVAIVIPIYLIASIQIYPYQPAVPYVPQGEGDKEAPLMYFHKVNTNYQRQVINFALTRIEIDVPRFTDYSTYQQITLFAGAYARQAFRYAEWNLDKSTYVVLHEPGVAGAYSEGVEFRSAYRISELRHADRVSTVYDNGGSFILYVPADLVPNYTLLPKPEEEIIFQNTEAE